MTFEDRQFLICRIFTNTFDNVAEANRNYNTFWYKNSIYLRCAKELGIYDSMKLTSRTKRYRDNHCITYNQWQAIKDKQLEILNNTLKSPYKLMRINAEKSLKKREFIVKIIDKFFDDMRQLDIENQKALKYIKILNTPPNENDTLYILKRIVKSEVSGDIIYQLSLRYREYLKKGFDTHLRDIKIFQRGFFKGFVTTDNRMIVLSMEQIEAYAFLLEHFVKIARHKNIKREARDAILRNLKKFINDPKSFDKYDVIYQSGKTYRSLWL